MILATAWLWEELSRARQALAAFLCSPSRKQAMTMLYLSSRTVLLSCWLNSYFCRCFSSRLQFSATQRWMATSHLQQLLSSHFTCLASRSRSHCSSPSSSYLCMYLPSKADLMAWPTSPPRSKLPQQISMESIMLSTSSESTLILRRDRMASSQALFRKRILETQREMSSWLVSSSMYFCRSSKQFSTRASLFFLASPSSPCFSGLLASPRWTERMRVLTSSVTMPFSASSLSSRKLIDLPRYSSARFYRISPALNSFTAQQQFPSFISTTPFTHRHRHEQSSAIFSAFSSHSRLYSSRPTSRYIKARKQRAREWLPNTGWQLSIISRVDSRIYLEVASSCDLAKSQFQLGCCRASRTSRTILQRRGSAGMLPFFWQQRSTQVVYLVSASSCMSLSDMRRPSQRVLLQSTSESLPNTSLTKHSYSSQVSRHCMYLLRKNQQQALNCSTRGYMNSFYFELQSSFFCSDYSMWSVLMRSSWCRLSTTPDFQCSLVDSILGTARSTDLVEKCRILPLLDLPLQSFSLELIFTGLGANIFFSPFALSLYRISFTGLACELSRLIFISRLSSSSPLRHRQVQSRLWSPSSNEPLMMSMKAPTTLPQPSICKPTISPSRTTFSASQYWQFSRQSWISFLQALRMSLWPPWVRRQYSRWSSPFSLSPSLVSVLPKQQ